MLARENTSQMNLFEETSEIDLPDPELPECERWGSLELLRHEKEVTGMYVSGHPLDNFKIHIKSYCNAKVGDLKNLHAIKNKEVCIAGIITSASHKYTKTGKPYGTFQIEDYSDSYQLFLFSEDYLKMKHFLETQNTVMIKAQVQVNRRNPTQLEIKIKSISLLSDLVEKDHSALILTLPVSDVNDQFVDRMQLMVKKHKGKARLKIQIHDPVEKISVDMLSRQIKVEPIGFLKDLLKQYDVKYRLN